MRHATVIGYVARARDTAEAYTFLISRYFASDPLTKRSSAVPVPRLLVTVKTHVYHVQRIVVPGRSQSKILMLKERTLPPRVA